MNERASRFLRPIALGTSLALASTGAVSAQEASPTTMPSPSTTESYFDPNNYDFRAAVMAPKSIFVCYSDIMPFHDSEPERIPQNIIIVEDADCEEYLPILGEVVIFENIDAEIELVGNAEVTSLSEFREGDQPVPPIFDLFPDHTVIYEE